MPLITPAASIFGRHDEPRCGIGRVNCPGISLYWPSLGLLRGQQMSEYKSGYKRALFEVEDEFRMRALYEPVTYELVLAMLAEMLNDVDME